VKQDENIRHTIEKYLDGTSSAEELRKAISYLSDPVLNQDIRTILEEIWLTDQISIPAKEHKRDFSAILDQIHSKIKLESKKLLRQIDRLRMIKTAAGIAAALLIGVILGVSTGAFKKAEPIVYTSIAPSGSISQMILPDNTLVYLNSESEIKYIHRGSRGNPEVFLYGEAWFQVTEDKKKSFVVHTDWYDVQVTGTEFNVRAYRDEREIVTTLESGTIVIPSTDGFRIKTNKELTPGQQMVYDRDKNMLTIRNVEPKYYTSWKDNKLMFINTSLKELVILLERRYGVDIEVSDKSILNYHYDGTFKNEGILEIMELIKTTLPIKYEVVGQVIKIRKLKEEDTK